MRWHGMAGYLPFPACCLALPGCLPELAACLDVTCLLGAVLDADGSASGLPGGVVVEALTAGGANIGEGILAALGQTLGDHSSISLRTPR